MPDLNLRNIALILRWWWKPYEEPNSMWAICISRLRTIIVQRPGLLIWAKKGSFFWNQLQAVKGIFDWSTTWIIGDGYRIAYWFDDWGQGILANSGNLILFRKFSLGDAAETQLLPVHGATLTLRDDMLAWRWSATAIYSASSAYKIMIGAGKIRWPFTGIWKLKLPPTVKGFLFLFLKGKILTREVLRRRNFQCELRCEMCNDQQVESALHLFFRCRHAQAIWSGLGLRGGNQYQTVGESWKEVSDRDSILASSAIWELWKCRNRAIFDNKKVAIDVTVQWIIHEATLWRKFC